MRWFVTGATGFIGRHLCERLRQRGDIVHALVRTPAKAAPLNDIGCEIVTGDLSVFADPGLDLPEVDYVVHLAGVVTADNPKEYDAINRGAVRDLIDCVERQTWAPKRFLFASSLAAGGPSPVNGRPLTEDDTPAPIDLYGKAKAAAEPIVTAASFPTTTFRPPIVIGSRDPAMLTLFKAASKGLGFGVLGHKQAISWIYIDDLVDAVVAMAEVENTSDHTYYLSGPKHATTDELWVALEAAVGRRVRVVRVPRSALWLTSRLAIGASRVFGFRNQLDDKQYRQITAPAFLCSSERLQAETDWRPQVALAEAVQRTFDGYAADGWL